MQICIRVRIPLEIKRIVQLVRTLVFKINGRGFESLFSCFFILSITFENEKMKIFFTKSIPCLLIDNQYYFEINDLRACIYARNAFLPSNRFFRRLLGDSSNIKRVVFKGQIVKVVNLTGLLIILRHSKVLKFNNSDSLLSEVTNLFDRKF